ncbi:unnamed protein product [Ectocarpus sp. 6 AP-2014]
MDAEGYDFLRQLHGLPRRHTPNLRASPLTEAAARRRLSLFATLAGNDFADFKNIGPVRAAKVAFELIEPDPRGTAAVVPFEALVGNLARIVVQDSKEEETPAALEEAEEKLRRSHNMFHNAVVWDPLKNTLRHFSCAASSLAITKDTDQSTLEFSSVASGIASGEVSPTTGQVWAPPLLETRIAQEFRRATRRAGRQTPPPPPPPPGPTPTPDQSTGRNKRSRKAVTHDTNNYHKHGFSRLPGAEEDFNKWTVAQLREFLSVFRCLDHAGHSAYLKGPLAELAGQVVAMIKKCGLLNSNQAFRHPVPDLSSFQDKERMAMPELPGPRSRISGFEHLQQHLPKCQVGDSAVPPTSQPHLWRGFAGLVQGDAEGYGYGEPEQVVGRPGQERVDVSGNESSRSHHNRPPPPLLHPSCSGSFVGALLAQPTSSLLR